ncbi:MAG: T9SS type A sorting domain-containing protein [Chitinophagaceae bacterium]|nr:T9SS type A sorting domain-containing protein [Chitinophagaceae bacterium]
MKNFYFFLVAALLSLSGNAQTRSVTYNIAGNYTFYVPCGVTQITVEAWGAGGNANNTSAGGGGAFAKGTISVTPNTLYNVHVGSPSGTANTRDSYIYLTPSNHLVKASGANGGTGGTVLGSIGDERFSGGNGGNRNGHRGGGGGGSSASSASNGIDGNNATNNNGAAGGTLSGGGNGGNGGTGTNAWFSGGGNGQNGMTPGGGGGQGGLGTGFWGWNGNNGNGANGQVIITYDGQPYYCIPTIGYDVEPITYVKFSDITRSSSNVVNNGTPGYENFCDIGNVVKGQSYTLTVNGNTNGNRTDYFMAYIDWNGDGDFNDAGENISIGYFNNSNGTDGKSASVSITIPAGAAIGETKMRIVKNRNSYGLNSTPRGCGIVQNGQIEDYILNIQDPNATITAFNPESGCVGSTVIITGTNFNSATDVLFNGTSASSFDINSNTQISAVVPAGATTGKISVVTPSNTAISANNFTVSPTTSVTSITGGGIVCGSTTLNATGSGTIYFQGTDPNGTNQTTGASASVTTSGTYYFRSFNGTCWSPALSVDVTVEQTPPAVNVTGPSVACGQTTINASGGGGYPIYFQGTTSGGTSTADPATTKIITTSGTYYFRALSACGWGTEGSITVTINALPAPVTVSASPVQFCRASGTVLTATGGSGGTIYFQGTTPGGTSTADPRTTVSVNTSGTYYFRSLSPSGCWGDEGSITVTENAGFSITTQPSDLSVCVGQNATFSVSVNPTTGVTYQWYKDGSIVSGATGSSFTLNNVQLSDASYDIYCLITDACGNASSNHVSLVVNQPVTQPASQPTNLQFVVGATSIGGTFTVSDADGYLVIRTNSPTAPSAPVDGQTYTIGSAALGGVVEYFGTDNLFSSTGLAQGTTYYYWVFAYNTGEGGCGTSPDYLNTNPLNGSATTATTTNSCPSGLTTLYWAGEGSELNQTGNTNFNDYRNWSLNPTIYQTAPSAPTECTDVVVKLRNETFILFFIPFVNNPNLILSSDTKVHDFYLSSEIGGVNWTGIFEWNSNSNVSVNLNQHKLEVFGNAIIEIKRSENTVRLGDLNGADGGIMDFKADVTIGANNYNDGEAAFVGGTNTKAIFRGSLTFGKLGEVGGNNNPVNAVFDGTGPSLITWNNTVNRARFRNVTIGVSNSPQVYHSGTADNIIGNLEMNNASRLFLNAGQQWNRNSNGGTLTMNNTSNLTLYGNASTLKGGTATLISGSNFPSGFGTTLGASTTVCYYGGSSITQTINNVPTYGHIALRSGPKVNNGQVNFNGSVLIADNASWTMNADVNGQQTTSSLSVKNTASLWTGDKLVKGNGKFILEAGGTLGIGSPDGITSSGAAGNIRNTGAITFDSDASYVYNGTLHQVTGNGLPLQQRRLEVNNSANVELTRDAEPIQLLKLTSGNLEIKANTLTLNSISYGSNKLVGSDFSNVTVKGTNVGLYLANTSRGNYLKELVLLDNAIGQISLASSDTLNITGGYDNLGQEGHLRLGDNSKIVTGTGNLTIKSNKYGTASIAEIPVDLSGNAKAIIDGAIGVERYINIGTGTGEHRKAWHVIAPNTSGQTIKQSWMEDGDNSVEKYGINLTGAAGGGWDDESPAPAIKYYVPSSGQGSWAGAPNSSTLLDSKSAWMVFIRGDRSVTGQWDDPKPTTLRSKGTIKTGTQTIPVPAIANGFYLIGNPYPSAVDVRTVTGLGTSGTYYVWNPNLGGNYGLGAYQTFAYDGTNYISVPQKTGKPDTIYNNIQSGQGFFVQTSGTAYNVIFKEDTKVDASDNTMFFRGNGEGSRQVGTLRSNVLSGDGAILDGTLQFFSDDYSNEVDMADGRKMMNTGINLSVKVSNDLLVVERRALLTMEDTIYYNLTGAANGKYTFSLEAAGLSASGLEGWLEDAFTGQRHAVNMEGLTNISFDITGAAASKAANRFRLVFRAALGPVPVTFVKINAVKDGNTVKVTWDVANEINLQKYVVMKSADGNTFHDLAEVKAAGRKQYTLTDDKPMNGFNYYRIRSVDKDGSQSFSTIAKVWMGGGEMKIGVFPNPIRDGVVKLRFENAMPGKYVIRLYNPAGQTIVSKEISIAGGAHSESIPWDYKMAHGTYQLEVTKPDGSRKMIIVMY